MDELVRLEVVFESNYQQLSQLDPGCVEYRRLKGENQRNLERRRELLGL
ncbi:MAG TPA: hypothetical protein PKI66_04610 [Methanobacteriaceae archaeon]|nr:hypothetical protein [Methanobacteriaceae archaeon]HNS25782.1 hypothetical protein [Methanobacteriaceae archaeon]